MKNVYLLILSLVCAVSLQAATGIFGAYVTIGGTKYKSSSDYAGGESTLGASSLGSFDVDTDSLIFSQGETLTYQNSGHSTFGFATAYRVRLASEAKSTDAAAYNFVLMGDGVDLGGGDEKGEFTVNYMPEGVYRALSIDDVDRNYVWTDGESLALYQDSIVVKSNDTLDVALQMQKF